MKTNGFFLLALFLSFTICVIPVHALRNPSAVYCQALGYTYEITDTPAGQVGYCKVSDSADYNAWDFLWGKSGTNYSYCARQGLGQRVGRGEECGEDNENAECLVCILPDGSTQEVTQLIEFKLQGRGMRRRRMRLGRKQSELSSGLSSSEERNHLQQTKRRNMRSKLQTRRRPGLRQPRHIRNPALPADNLDRPMLGCFVPVEAEEE